MAQHKDKHADRINLGIKSVSIAAGAACPKGAVLAGVVDVASDPISDRVANKYAYEEQRPRIGAGIEDRIRKYSGIHNHWGDEEWSESVIHLEKTIRHCGFPY